MKRAVFLDRDGTLVRVYENRPANTADEIELLPGVPEGLKQLKSAGYELIVVTNQGGIGHGYMTHEDIIAMNLRLNEFLKNAGAPQVDQILWCPHTLTEGCFCRKPKPGLIFRAIENTTIDLSNSFLVGDSVSDIRAGQAAKLRKNFLVVSDRYEENSGADMMFSTFLEAASAICQLSASTT